jgi:hypothetical protein
VELIKTEIELEKFEVSFKWSKVNEMRSVRHNKFDVYIVFLFSAI